ncbi:glycosyltransferase family 39 protein [Candidatus Gottesmanbacteria bacterium]|nr:glycosyltransferase family 39 protein [Candidatus Gottesmanbacteria bacterium]
MSKQSFFLILIAISLLGLVLRVVDYDRVPAFGETRDEFMYPWAGMSLLLTGVPSSWSYFDSYTNYKSIYLWDQEFRIVTPWFDKPLLYPIMTGSVMLVTGATQFGDIQISILRLLPLAFSFISIILLGIFARHTFGPPVGILTALLYATTPQIVIANRLSLTENLFIPLSLGVLVLLLSVPKPGTKRLLCIGLLSGLGFLTKQIGVSLFTAVAVYFIWRRQWRNLLITSIPFALSVLVHLAVAYMYDFKLYLSVMSDFRHGHTLAGLPELVMTIFRYPGISEKTRPFLDSTMLLGFILLFASPFFLFTKERDKNDQVIPFLLFPFTYLAFLVLLESGATPYSFFGWHVFPLYPFIATLVAYILYRTWRETNLFQLLILILVLGSSSVRFFLMFFPREVQHRWQYLLTAAVVIALIAYIRPLQKYKKVYLIVLLGIFISVHIYTVINLGALIGSSPQPRG